MYINININNFFIIYILILLKYNAILLKTGQSYMLSNQTVGKLYYPDRMAQ